jgi:hypothetical protein
MGESWAMSLPALTIFTPTITWSSQMVANWTLKAGRKPSYPIFMTRATASVVLEWASVFEPFRFFKEGLQNPISQGICARKSLIYIGQNYTKQGFAEAPLKVTIQVPPIVAKMLENQ